MLRCAIWVHIRIPSPFFWKFSIFLKKNRTFLIPLLSLGDKNSQSSVVCKIKRGFPKTATEGGVVHVSMNKKCLWCFQPLYECALQSRQLGASFDVYMSFLRQIFFSLWSLEPWCLPKNCTFGGAIATRGRPSEFFFQKFSPAALREKSGVFELHDPPLLHDPPPYFSEIWNFSLRPTAQTYMTPPLLSAEMS